MIDSGGGRAPQRILIVDDSHDCANSLARLLQLMGHEVATAFDGIAGGELAETFRPDVIVLDIGLPERDGCALARDIRAQPWGRSVLLIASTGWGHADARRRSMDAGFDYHLVKPVDVTQLATLLKTAVKH